MTNEFLTQDSNWITPDVFDAIAELLNKDGMGTSAKFREDTTYNKAKLCAEVMAECNKITNESNKPTNTENFKANFRQAFDQITKENPNWFERVDGGWDTAI